MSTFLSIEKRRNHNKELLDACEAFEMATHKEVYNNDTSTCGNIIDMVNGEYVLDGKYKGGIFKNNKPFHEQVSAPYLLSRLVAAGFTPDVCGQEGYKVTWIVYLKHKQSGHFVTFYDYKGASSIGSDVYGDKAPNELVSDLRSLAKALADNRFPHPYDGCVVGEIA